MSRSFVGVVFAVSLLGLVSAFGTIDTIEDFAGPYVGGPVGPYPDGWNYFGYGPPLWTEEELTLTLGDSAYRLNLPLAAVGDPVGTSLLYVVGVSVDDFASQPINWTYPVTLTLGVYGHNENDLDTWQGVMWVDNYTISRQDVDFTSANNDTWQTVQVVLDPGQGGKTGNVVFGLNFDVTNGAGGAGQNTLILDQLALGYVAIPEPVTVGLLALGGLTLLRRRSC